MRHARLERALRRRSSRTRLGRFLGNRRLLLGLVLVAGIALVAVVGPYLAPDPNAIVLRNRSIAPFAQGFGQSPLGTDQLGRDMLSRIVYGARISLTVGVVSTVVAALVGAVLGMVAGFFGGKTEFGIMRVTDLIMCYPFTITSIIAAALLAPGIKTIILIFSAFGWTSYCRVIHGVALSVKQELYVEASRAVGASSGWILWKHILPGILPSLVVSATLQVRQMILGEATLSFLGIGIQPPTPSWGVLISTGREYLSTAWWISTLPGIALAVLILGFSLLGDGLTDYLNPRL